jgi:hypothetical protein
MGLAVGDYENNGNLDIVSTTFCDDYDVVFHNDGGGTFTELNTGSTVASGSGTLEFEVVGSSLKLILNGQLIASAIDTTFTTGSVEPLP